MRGQAVVVNVTVSDEEMLQTLKIDCALQFGKSFGGGRTGVEEYQFAVYLGRIVVHFPYHVWRHYCVLLHIDQKIYFSASMAASASRRFSRRSPVASYLVKRLIPLRSTVRLSPSSMK